MKKVRNILLVALVALTVMSMYSVAGTYAKYVTTETATDTARVAKWDIEFDVNRSKLNNDDLDLFGDAAVIAPGMDGSVEIAIKNNGEVAAVMELLQFAETNNDNIPLKYCITTTETVTGYATPVNCTDKGNFVTMTALNGQLATLKNQFLAGASHSLKLYWMWETNTAVLDADGDGIVTAAEVAAYEAANAADTTLGTDAYAATSAADIPSVTITATVVVSQITE